MSIDHLNEYSETSAFNFSNMAALLVTSRLMNRNRFH